jgi:hypothetical protein
METETEVGTYIALWEAGGGASCVVPADEPQIDVAVSEFRRSHRDEVLHLTLQNGMTYRVCASHIVGWTISTPEGRRREASLEAARREEARANRAAVGLPWGEGDE